MQKWEILSVHEKNLDDLKKNQPREDVKNPNTTQKSEFIIKETQRESGSPDSARNSSGSRFHIYLVLFFLPTEFMSV